MRPLDSARVSRWGSQRSMTAQQMLPSIPQGWAQVWRLSSPFSFFPPFSFFCRFFFFLPFFFFPAFFFFLADFFLPAAFFFPADFLAFFFFDDLFFFFFLPPFFAFFFAICSLLSLLNKRARASRPELSNRRRQDFARANVLNLVRLHVMVKDVGVQANTSIPGNRRSLRIDAHLFELSHIAPQLEGADLEQVAEEYAAFQAVLEAQPQLIVVFSLACGDAHRVVLVHGHSQFSAPPVWYSITRVSKKLRSFFRSIISLIHGKGFCAPGYSVSRPICWQRRLAMKRRYSLNIGAFNPRTPRGMVSSA